MKKILFAAFSTSLLFLLAIALLPAVTVADSSSDQTIETAKRLSQHLDSLSSLSFQFTQRTSGQMSGRPRQASGTAFFVKNETDAKMRWNYSAPDLQVIISDGITLSMYFEQMKQMIVTPAESLQQDVTYSFFTGRGNIEVDFLILPGLDQIEQESQDNGFEVIKLIPRSPGSQTKDIRLWVTAASHIKRIEVRDNFDTITVLNISNIEENSLVKDGRLINTALFDFTPPEGTEIIEQ
jgi:outer membrane lipoprotein carrier protein